MNTHSDCELKKAVATSISQSSVVVLVELIMLQVPVKTSRQKDDRNIFLLI